MTRGSILLVDDEPKIRQALTKALRDEGHDVTATGSPREALRFVGERPYDLLIADNLMPELTGLELIREIVNVAGAGDRPQILMMTAHATVESAIEAMKLGALDYLQKPFEIDEFLVVVDRAIAHGRLRTHRDYLITERDEQFDHYGIIGRSRGIQEMVRTAKLVAQSRSTVLITGETGTGKELVARAFHDWSAQREMPLVRVNCGALPDTLLESELFGHMRGAFTGADTNKKGLLEVAEKGTIFLDEIGEMSAMTQVKLLRVLQERKFRRLGGTEEVEANIRIIAATNRDLSKMVAAGDFREDLFYRINVIPVKLPPLRERQDDVQALAEHFVEKYAAQMKKELHGISGAAMTLLRSYPWPGNVRELENAIERAVALERTPSVLSDSLPDGVRAASASPASAAAAAPPEDLTLSGGFDLEQHVQDIEREYIMEALRRSNGVKKNAAELLGLSFRQFRYLLKKYNIQ